MELRNSFYSDQNDQERLRGKLTLLLHTFTTCTANIYTLAIYADGDSRQESKTKVLIEKPFHNNNVLACAFPAN